ncbi:DENN domain-containing protein [Verticillium alfalfae VaMs.102]|uniref:DENN domain-containing protein n=1 Tax=Verticillium alfalfae (strain VaMs.102 / ATCC MYA-4576 / FGSC 10136) TaxID=526221 RepID=C9SAC2_VERA1|nr:DENN domain-containing protein [Verticillium alfalfae VaMs.102]EEY15399.1 DENN domain-containing protein [Verticillium alfalfae VaMs.102]
MAPSLHAHSSFTRPRTGDREGRPTTRTGRQQPHHPQPYLFSSLSHHPSRFPPPSTSRPSSAPPKTLTHAYMVCGVGREPSQWVKAPAPAQGKIGHMKGAVGQFWLPEILGSSPRLEQDNEIARALHAAMRACFPHDVEICTGRSQPHCVHHAFVLQQDSSHTLYGISLRVWSRADEKRAETIRDLRKRTESDFYDNPDETYWIPYCLSFLSRYPLYNLLGDYLRGMWIHWNKATNLFHAEEVSRILSFPAPRLNDLVRIDMKDYALCYQFPSSPTGFQNFAMWPLFCCLSIPNIVGVIEAAISPTRRIIFVSHYPAMLTMAAETVRYCVRVYEWSGLYVPVVHARHAKELVQEPGPYILGITAECRSLFHGAHGRSGRRPRPQLCSHLEPAYRAEPRSAQQIRHPPDPDFINLKGRMDTELSKVTKRNNYLVEELESWKQQFLKFQAFAEQLTKETQDLKTKIENHKRENRRLGGLIDQQKDDNARLSVRLAGTEKQRDDALEALVLQQEIAEELERERKRNKKELSALQHTNMTILRQRDEARRVVLHLRSLIGGQSHHMEHLVRSLTKPEEISSELEDGFENDEDVELQQGEVPSDRLSPEAENNLRSAARANKRMSSSSFIDVADRHLKDKTDAIAHIIRNIAEQCQAAVEGLSLAQDAELDERARLAAAHRRHSNLSVAASDDGHDSHSNATASELGDDSLLQPASGRTSSIPPTPDLVPNRSSTAMSFASTATTPERSSQQYMIHQDIPTKIVEDDGEDLEEGRSESDTAPQEHGLVGKHASSLIHRPSGARISALGGSR